MDNTNQSVQKPRKKHKPCEVCGNGRQKTLHGKCVRCWKRAYDAAMIGVRRQTARLAAMDEATVQLQAQVREVQVVLALHQDKGVCSCHLFPKVQSVVGKLSSPQSQSRYLRPAAE